MDVSAAQGPIDWLRVRQSAYTFAFVRATDGADTIDPGFATNWPACREAGLIRSAYHVLDPRRSAIDQAKAFLEVAQPQIGDLPPALAVAGLRGAEPEATAATLTEWLQIVADTVGAPPLIATAARVWDPLAAVGAAADENPLWVIAPGADEPPLPVGWSTWTFWRLHDDRTIPGLDGPAHVDAFAQGTRELFAMLLR
ncbi:MAG: glycoside hydrolase family 25 protein [Acidobacteriota bacterium]